MEQSEIKGTISVRVSAKPVVAIVGRQNVGKSTLLNRMVKKRLAITSEIPGTTRDRIMADVTWNDIPFIVIDTGGLPPKTESEVDHAVIAQVEEALLDADIIIFLVDVRDGATPYDEEIAGRLHRTGKPVILTVNKVDTEKLLVNAAEFYRLGLGEPAAISAYHNIGVNELMDKIVSLLPPVETGAAEDSVSGLKIAIVGRPGVGKSMLLNALLGEERAIVTGKPGTTRDTIDSLIDFQGQNVLLIDTAGIRRRGQVAPGVEKYSVIRSMEAIDRADIAMLVIDATEVATNQDTHIAGYIVDAGKGLILLVNKWDLIDVKAEEEYTQKIRTDFIFAPYAPILYISAKTKQGLEALLPEAVTVFAARVKRVPSEELSAMLARALAAHVPPHTGKRQLKLFSVSQSGINPPTFTFKANDPTLLHFSYQRYLENQLRAAFGFTGTPVKLEFKPARR
jgi:GTP-binding protein